MTRNLSLSILFAALVLVILAVLLSPNGAVARDSSLHTPADPLNERAVASQLNTTFIYQGKLTDNGSPANGAYDFQFTLYDTLVGGSQVGSPVTVGDLTVTDGIFSAALDFGSVFDGTAYWLNIAVRPGDSTGAYTILAPRQPLTAAPYAAGLVPGAVISGTHPAPGGMVTLSNAAGDGLVISQAGNPSSAYASVFHNGLQVEGAEGHGLYVGRVDLSGVVVASAGNDGVFVDSAGDVGVSVNSAGNDGVYVGSAGNAGLFVGSAGLDGVYVGSAVSNGVFVGSAGIGLSVFSASFNGVDVAGDSLAGYFSGNIQVTGSCTGCLLATFGVNNGNETLQPGELVTIQGVQPSGTDSVPMLMEVVKAKNGQTIVGVVGGWAELIAEEEPRPTEIGLRLIPREGPAAPGAYVTIIYSGPVQVRASSPQGFLAPGTRLTLGNDGGVRALQTTTVNGIQIAESVPVIGIALSEPDAKGLVWVLVNPQ